MNGDLKIFMKFNPCDPYYSDHRGDNVPTASLSWVITATFQ